jgi:transcriptional regulator with XRE-family HTH domain
MDAMTFREWINHKYIEWRGASRSTISQFASYIGVPQSTLSRWMNEDMITMPRADIIARLAELFGDDVYEVLHLPSPQRIDQAIATLATIIEEYPAEIRPLINGAIDQTIHQVREGQVGYGPDQIEIQYLHNLQALIAKHLDELKNK